MTQDIDQADGIGGRHGTARTMAERAMAAKAAGDEDEANRLFAEATRIDPDAVETVLAAHAHDQAVIPADLAPQNDDEIAAMSRTVEPHSDAHARSGVSGRGSGADGQGT